MPALLKLGEAPEVATIAPVPRSFNVPPAMLFQTAPSAISRLPLPVQVAEPRLSNVSPSSSRALFDRRVVVPPGTTVTVPVPDIVPTLHNSELSDTGPEAEKLPPATVSVFAILELDSSDSDPASIEIAAMLERLFTESATLELCVTVMPAMLITALSFGPGTTPPFQFDPVFQSPPLVLSQVIVDNSERSSSRSSINRENAARDGRPSRCRGVLGEDFLRRRRHEERLMRVSTLRVCVRVSRPCLVGNHRRMPLDTRASKQAPASLATTEVKHRAVITG